MNGNMFSSTVLATFLGDLVYRNRRPEGSCKSWRLPLRTTCLAHWATSVWLIGGLSCTWNKQENTEWTISRWRLLHTSQTKITTPSVEDTPDYRVMNYGDTNTALRYRLLHIYNFPTSIVGPRLASHDHLAWTESCSVIEGHYTLSSTSLIFWSYWPWSTEVNANIPIVCGNRAAACMGQHQSELSLDIIAL